MLIRKLGETRGELLESFKDLSDEQINQKPAVDKWSISQVVSHVSMVEKNVVKGVLEALKAKSEKVEEKDLSFVTDRSKKVKSKTEPSSAFLTKQQLMDLLEDSRFNHLRSVFNEAHEVALAEKSMNHPAFGVISLKNMVDFIWMHEARHIEQIKEIKQELGF